VEPDPPGVELENDPEDNVCFACGPRNPAGLRMRFFDDGAWVRSRLVLDDRYSGGPGRVLDGIVFSAMDDTIWWAAWARWGELAWVEEVESVRFGSVRTGEAFLVQARPVENLGHAERWEAVVVQGTATVSRMQQRLRRRTDDEIRQQLASPALPRSIRAELEAALARRSAGALTRPI